MKFPFSCSECGHVNQAVWSQVGKEIECHRCGEPLTVPAPLESIAEPKAAPPPQRLKFRCPSCRRKFSTKAEMAGQKIRCTGCGAGVRVPWAEEALGSEMPSSEPAVPVLARDDEIEAAPAPVRIEPVRPDVPRVDLSRPAARAEKAVAPTALKSPELGALVEIDDLPQRRRPESVLMPRSAMVELPKPPAFEDEIFHSLPGPARAPRTLAPKKKKKQSSFFDPKETLKLVAGVGALVVVLAFAAWAYPEFRLPLGGVLCVIGFIVYVLGAVSLRQLVAEEGMLKLLLFRFFPPYQWWFIFTRWQETRDYLAFFMAGAMVMSVGGAIIKISPLSIKAEAAERAYMQKIERRQADRQQPAISGIAVERDD